MGMYLADLTLQLGPSVVLSLLFFAVPSIMAREAIFPFLLNYFAFGAAFIPCIYLMTHLFDEVETATKWIGPLTLLCLLIIPVGIACLIALGIKGDYGAAVLLVVSGLVVIDPMACFVIACWNLSCAYKPQSVQDLSLALFGADEPTSTWFTFGVLIAQAVIIQTINILIDIRVQ